MTATMGFKPLVHRTRMSNLQVLSSCKGRDVSSITSSTTLGKSPYLPGSLWPYLHGAKVPRLLLKTASIIRVLFSPDKTTFPNIWGQLNTTLPFLSKHPTYTQTYTRMYRCDGPNQLWAHRSPCRKTR